MAQPKPKKVCYRKCIADIPASANGSVFNLQSELLKATTSVSKPWIRMVGIGDARQQFLMHVVDSGGILAGTLVLCESGKPIPLVDAEKDGSSWEGVIQPNDADGNPRRLQEQELFFAVRENHVAVAQSLSLTIDDLNGFFRWLIQDKAGSAVGTAIYLMNVPAKSAEDKLRDNQIKKIEIGRNALWVEKIEQPAKEGAKRRRFIKEVKTDPMLFGLLRNVLENNPIVDDLEKSKDPGAIHVALEISYKSKTEKDAQEVMRALAGAVGGDDNYSPEITLSGNQKIKKDELTIYGIVKIQCPSGNLSKDDGMRQVAEWLRDAIKSGKVV